MLADAMSLILRSDLGKCKVQIKQPTRCNGWETIEGEPARVSGRSSIPFPIFAHARSGRGSDIAPHAVEARKDGKIFKQPTRCNGWAWLINM
jgi:hypothetical protein